MVAIKDLKAGQELSCHYMIDMEEAADESIRYHPYIMYHFKGDKQKTLHSIVNLSAIIIPSEDSLIAWIEGLINFYDPI